MMFNFQNSKVIINQRFDRFYTDIWVAHITDTFDIYINIDEKGNLIETKLPMDRFPSEDEVKPFLSLPTKFADFFIKSLVEYASGINIKTKDQTLIEGKLAATEKHLEDMREISKKLIDNIVKNKL